MIHGIVSLLDNQHYSLVEELWRDLEREFNVSWMASRVPFPHVSYHVAQHYDIERVEAALKQLSARLKPIRAKVTGLGIFTGSQPVLMLPVVRSPALEELHRGIWQAIDGAATGVVDYYRAENWVPHVTLAQGDLSAATLGRIIGHFHDRPFDWEFMVDNLSMIYDDGMKHDISARMAIGVGR